MIAKKLRVFLICLLFMLTAFPVNPVQAKNIVSIPPGSGTNQSSPGYSPSTITVVVGVNNTVIWLNNDTVPHTVTPSTLPAGGNWSVGSGNLAVAQTYQFTFTVPGRYTYVCAYHSWMHGTVIVKSGSTVPEFPGTSLAAVLLVTVVLALLALQRFRPRIVVPRAVS